MGKDEFERINDGDEPIIILPRGLYLMLTLILLFSFGAMLLSGFVVYENKFKHHNNITWSI